MMPRNFGQKPQPKSPRSENGNSWSDFFKRVGAAVAVGWEYYKESQK